MDEQTEKLREAVRNRSPRGMGLGKALLLTVTVPTVAVIIVVWASESYANYKFKRLSSAEHLKAAQDICHTKVFADDCTGGSPGEAAKHLYAIPASASERKDALDLLTIIKRKELSKESEPANSDQNESASTSQNSERNFTCSRGYPKSCAKGEDDGPCAFRPIMSFNNGTSWEWDDGRCAAKEQKQRDEAAEMDSYWPTTLRVDTDMDSFWLNNEERTCQTYPDNKGHVAVVACNASGSHRDHNIPVRFWGGVDRNVVSNWKCRREGEDFVCRALD